MVLVWSDHIYRWHSPETDNQAFSPSPSSVVAVHGPAFWLTLFPSTIVRVLQGGKCGLAAHAQLPRQNAFPREAIRVDSVEDATVLEKSALAKRRPASTYPGSIRELKNLNARLIHFLRLSHGHLEMFHCLLFHLLHHQRFICNLHRVSPQLKPQFRIPLRLNAPLIRCTSSTPS
jgi:hypothetical protein